jgi:phosphoribosylanthranilate isomerase
LDAGNVNKAVARFNPFGVDVSSGVESGGQKDGAKIERFIQLAREGST